MGTRDYSASTNAGVRDHPHACGDKSFADISRSPIKGSSPRVWGQDTLETTLCCVLGIIPTRVGTSVCKSHTCDRVRDHPHACGDKRTYFKPLRCTAGSSPRVWGQAMKYKLLNLEQRIIPTRMGTSLRRKVSCCKTGIIPTRMGTRGCTAYQARGHRDHPHACGDKIKCAGVDTSIPGSSPRVWGQG